MKVAFDGQLLMKSCPTGIGRYAENILNSLNVCTHELELNVFDAGKRKDALNVIAKYEKCGYKIRKFERFSDVWYKLISAVIPLPYSMFFGGKSDVTVFFNYVIPPGVKGKKIVYVHDMAYKIYPETIRWKTRIWLSLNLERTKRRADKFVTISEFSKSEMVKHWGIEPDKIDVVYAGVNSDIYHSNYSDQEIDKIKQKYDISGTYFLYLGTLEPRKNIMGLLNAYLDMKLHLQGEIPKLVFAGKKGWMYQEIFEFISAHNLGNDICFTGYVTEEESAILMNGTEAFIFPSIYEGFGMPPLEAMACGAPVISSNVTAMPEVIGDAGILINPMSKVELFEAMMTIIQNKEVADDLGKKGVQRAKKFTWKKSAEALLEVIESVY